MRLETDGLILRTVNEADLDEVARMWKYPKAVSHKAAREALAYMENTHAQNRPGHICHLCLAVCLRDNERTIIGWCGLDGEISPGKVVIFYMIAAEHRRNGYATRCARRLIEYAFDEADCERIYGGCDKNNIASYRVMRSAGMRDAWTNENGDPNLYIDRRSYEQARGRR